MTAATETKVCTRCKAEKPLDQFNRHSAKKDGLDSHCRECKQAASHRYYHEGGGREVSLLISKRWASTETGKRSKKASARKYGQNTSHRMKLRAKCTVKEAVERGKIPRICELSCRHCGAAAGHYHHYSYKKENRLDVIPLCTSCHHAEHKRLRDSGISIPI